MMFKLNEMAHAGYLYCETGDIEHLKDIIRILFWNGKENNVTEDEEEPKAANNVIFVDWSKHVEWKEFEA